MANLRAARRKLKEILYADDWQSRLEEIVAGGMSNVGALLSFLPLEPKIMHRAAKALGMTVAYIYGQNPEAARNVVRGFMWRMNEESGNIGWGVPDAFAETLAASSPLADAYGRILDSYIMDLGFDDNYCDHDILRRDCYWAIGRLAQARPDLTEKARSWLVKGLQDEDSPCRGMAAWALAQMPPDLMDAPALRALANAGDADICEVFDGERIREFRVSDLAKMALERIEAWK